MRKVALPAGDRLGEVATRLFDVSALRVCADHQRQSILRKVPKERFVPEWRALGSRREIAARAGPRKAEPHRHQRNHFLVVELFRRNTEPRSESITARVSPWNPGLVDDSTRRLTDDHDPRLRADLHHRSRTQRQMLRTHTTRPDVHEQLVEVDRTSLGPLRCRRIRPEAHTITSRSTQAASTIPTAVSGEPLPQTPTTAMPGDHSCARARTIV